MEERVYEIEMIKYSGKIIIEVLCPGGQDA